MRFLRGAATLLGYVIVFGLVAFVWLYALVVVLDMVFG